MSILTSNLENTIGTEEHREEMIATYIDRGLSPREAQEYFRWAFPALSEKEIPFVHRRQEGKTGIYTGPLDSGETEDDEDWFVDGEEFIARELEPRAVYLSDKETGAPILYQSSINQLFATRGLGKSVVTNTLLKCLIGGQDFLRLTSTGGLNVLLVDGELPPIQIQERLKEFGEVGRLAILSPYLMAKPKSFPNLSQPADQERFLERIAGLDSQVIIFDTLTRCFRMDTNDSEAWLKVNDFLTDLRGRGYCVLLVHHEGKNGTQRGRTDGDDNLDVSIQLSKVYGWQPGDGLAFKWTYSKIRHGGNLPEFQAAYDRVGGWKMVEDDRLAEVLRLKRDGKSQRAIATALKIDQSTVCRMLRKVEKGGLAGLNDRADARGKP